MARYRKVEVVTWIDNRFRDLSPAKPCGQHLWLYLLTGPRTTSFPGLLVGREEAMAADLGWPVGPFREAFGEASAQGMAKADWRAGLVVLSKALLDSTGEPRDSAKPESPNVIKSWAKSWDEVPDCSLKYEYLRSLESFSKALGEGYHQAFLEGFRKGLAKASLYPLPNQDQDQEQKQEQKDKNSATPTAGGSLGLPGLESKIREHLGDIGLQRARGKRTKPSEPTPAEVDSVRVVLDKLGGQNGVAYSGTVEHVRLIANRLREGITEMDLRAIIGFCAVKQDWKNDPKMVGYLRPETLFGPKNISKYLDAARAWFATLPEDRKSPTEAR